MEIHSTNMQMEQLEHAAMAESAHHDIDDIVLFLLLRRGRCQVNTRLFDFLVYSWDQSRVDRLVVLTSVSYLIGQDA